MVYLITRIVVHGQLVEPTICFRDLSACEELIHSLLLDRSQIISCLDSKFFSIFMNKKFQFMIFTIVNDRFIVRLSSVTLTFNLPEQMFQMTNCAKLF